MAADFIAIDRDPFKVMMTVLRGVVRHDVPPANRAAAIPAEVH